jgi:hypothetical protein
MRIDDTRTTGPAGRAGHIGWPDSVRFGAQPARRPREKMAERPHWKLHRKRL